MKKIPRHGYTTGACAAAAARGAALLLRDQMRIERVAIVLPGGEEVSFALHGQRFDRERATCFVLKDAGDDPDVTNGCEVWAEVSLTPPCPPLDKGGSPQPPCPPLDKGGCPQGGGVKVVGGVGIGRVTKPGLAVPVGEWAINPVPRVMIAAAVAEVFTSHPSSLTPHVTISIPDGEIRAQRTLNARLGILGGLSILGTTGIVKPISHRAWTDTLDASLDVAVACGCAIIVLSTGRTSELAVQRFFSPPPLTGGGWREGEAVNLTPTPALPRQEGGSQISLPEEAFVMMGDHVGYALRACAQRHIPTIILAGQFAKLLKIACGHEQTHVSASALDLETLAGWLEASGASAAEVERCRSANTAREVLEGAEDGARLIELVCARARQAAEHLASQAVLKVFLAGYRSEMLYFR